MREGQTTPRARLVADLLRPLALARDAERGWLATLIGRGAWPELRFPLLAAWAGQWSSSDDEAEAALPIVHARTLAPEAPRTRVEVERVRMRERMIEAAKPAAAPPVKAQRLLAPTSTRAAVAPTPGPDAQPRLEHPAPSAAPRLDPSAAAPRLDPSSAAPRPEPSSAAPRPEPSSAAPRPGPSSADSRLDSSPEPSRPAPRPLPRVVAAFRRELAERTAAPRAPRIDAPAAARPHADPTPRLATPPRTTPTDSDPVIEMPAPERAGTRARPLDDDAPALVHPLAPGAASPPITASDAATTPSRDAPPQRDLTPRPIVAGTQRPTTAPPTLQHLEARAPADPVAPSPTRGPDVPTPTRARPAGTPAASSPRPRVAARPAAAQPVHPRPLAPPAPRARWEDSSAAPRTTAASRPQPTRPQPTRPSSALPHAQPSSARTSERPAPREPAAVTTPPSSPVPASPAPAAPAPPLDIDAIVETVERRLARELGRARAMRKLLR